VARSAGYFSYGTNMDPNSMHKNCPEAVCLGPGRLDGYRLEFNVYSDRWEGGAANLEVDPYGHVWGVVWAVTPQDLDQLDTYVGHPTFYRREDVRIRMGIRWADSVTYRVAHQRGFVRPTDAYLARMRRAIRIQGLPPEALDIVEQAARPPKPSIST
jgi:gamma-glutamylcyclotransferase (GGCT)/AIG2-like uncharacterized protein YtfP